MAPHLLVLALLSALLVVLLEGGRNMYGAALALGVLLLSAALLGWHAARSGRRIPMVHVPFYFVHVNLAALWASVLYLRGERKVTWTTVRA